MHVDELDVTATGSVPGFPELTLHGDAKRPPDLWQHPRPGPFGKDDPLHGLLDLEYHHRRGMARLSGIVSSTSSIVPIQLK